MTEDFAAYTFSPVDPLVFAGRREETDEVLSRAFHPKPPLQGLEGPSKIGRTSMLHHLRAISRGVARHPALKGREDRLIAPWIDLTLRYQRPARADTLIYEAIREEIKQHGLPAPDLPQGPAASAVVRARMEELTEEGYSFLLLVDRVEHLLTTKGFDDPERKTWGDEAMNALGELNERVAIAVVLAFGATGPAREVRPRARQLKMIEALHNLSHMLTRGNYVRTALGLLAEAEVRDFVEKAGRSEGSGGERELSPTEVDWLVEVSGGHPLVMQNAVLRLFEPSILDAAARRQMVERELAETALQGFLVDLFLRIDPIDPKGLAALEALGEAESVELEPELAEILQDEGMVRVDGSNTVKMPSRALRGALLVYLASRRADEAGRYARRPRLSARPPRATLGLADRDAGPTLRLTPSEHLLVKEMLAAVDGVSSRDELKAALGPDADDAQLNQRISVLRSKMRDSFDTPDAIVSVYGEGYRFDEPRRYELRTRRAT